MAAIVHDAELDATPELVHAAASAAALALDNERLKADLRARLEELRHSRRRIVEAADDARRQIERDLHDGAQQQLVSLALDLRLLRARLKHEPEVAATVEELADKLAVALAELRELARGIHPAVLSDHGLGPAIHVLVERSPLTVECDLAFDDRLPAPVEAAAYFVVAEGLTNVIKYANADEGHGERAAARAAMLEVVVGDDGVGGARIDAGSGLRGLSDRLAALEGELDARQPARRGHAPVRPHPAGGGALMRRAALPRARCSPRSPAAAGPRTCARPTSRSRASRRRASGRRRRPTPERGGGLRVAAARIAAISHGQASDPFWAIVKKGLDDAARQTGVAVSYRAPDSYDIARMRRLIDEAIEANLDGLIVSLPDVQGLRAAIQRARRAGIPVDLDQLRQRPLPRPRHPGPRRPARVPRRPRGRPPDGARPASAGACASTRRSATPGSTSAAAASAPACAARAAARPCSASTSRTPTRRSSGSRRRSATARPTASSRSGPPARCRRSPRCAPASAAASSSPPSTSRPRCCRPCGSSGCCSRSTSSRTCRATCRSCCWPSARATCCSRRAAS